MELFGQRFWLLDFLYLLTDWCGRMEKSDGESIAGGELRSSLPSIEEIEKELE